MAQGFGHLQGAREVDYRGTRFALGRTADAYAIWDLAGGPPVRTFPLTDEAWPDAWLTYQAWEAGGHSPTTGEPPPSAQQPAQPPGAAVMDYPGARHGLGRAEGRYFIWDLEARAAVESFPVTAEGWRDAWLRFQELERPYAYVPPRNWEKGRPVPIRAMRAGQIIGGALKLYFMHFWRLVAVAAIILIPLYAITGALAFATGELVPAEVASPAFGSYVTVNQQTFVWETPWWVDLVNAVVSLLGYSLLVGGVVGVLATGASGGRPSVPGGLRVAVRRLPPLVVVALIGTVAILVAALPAILSSLAVAANPSLGLALLDVLITLAVIAPILFVVVRFLYAPPSVVLEQKGGIDAVRRSWSLVRGLGWKALGTILLALLIVLGVFLVVFLVFLAVTLAALVSSVGPGSGAPQGFYVFFVGIFILIAVVAVILTPLVYVVTLLLYFDARVRKERFSEEVLARELTAASGVPATSQPAAPPVPPPGP
jgi:hypothetical protein